MEAVLVGFECQSLNLNCRFPRKEQPRRFHIALFKNVMSATSPIVKNQKGSIKSQPPDVHPNLAKYEVLCASLPPLIWDIARLAL